MVEAVGRYSVTGPIGSGGFGTVYLGTDPDTGEQVAIKVLDHPEDGWRRDLMRAEAAALLQVDSPHCVRIRDVIDEPDLAAIVTDFVDGASLRRILHEAGRLDGRQALGVLTGALDGLAAVHAAGLVHGDLKPDNIVVDRDGVSRLIDFGLAAPPHRLGGPDTWIGTPAYLAPEQFLGHHTDIRSDLYAAGVVLFELLCGRTPYVGSDPLMTAALHVQAPVPDPRAVQPHVGDALAGLCLMNLAKDPDLRHQNARAFHASLEYAARERFGSTWATGAGLGATVGTVLSGVPAGLGLLGSAGVTGPVVAAGAAGSLGAAATAAATAGGTGAVAAGAVGTAEASGVAGASGAIGTAGAAGTVGAAGVSGAAGAAGVSGASGAAGAAGTAGASGAAGAAGLSGTAGGAAVGGSGLGTVGGAAGALGGAKVAAAGIAVIVAAAAGGGAAAYVATRPDEKPAPPAAAAFEPAILAAYTTQGQSGAIRAFVLDNDGTPVPVDGIKRPESGSAPPYDVLLATSDDGRYVAATDGRTLSVVSGADPTDQQTIDCSCVGVTFGPDGTLVALTTDETLETFEISGDGVEVASTVPIDGVPATDRTDPNRFYASDLLGLDDGTAYVVLPGPSDGFYFESVVMTVDLDTGKAAELLDLGIDYVGSRALSADRRYLAFDTGPGDGCFYSALTVIDLEASRPGSASVSRISGPDGLDGRELAGGRLASLWFDDQDLVADWETGDFCGGASEPTAVYRTTVGGFGPSQDPVAAADWQPDGIERGITWRALAHDGRQLSTWLSADFAQELWLGDPEGDGEKVAGDVVRALSVGPPGDPVDRDPPSRGTEEVDVDPWFGDGTLKPGFTIEDRSGGGYAIDCTYDTGSPVSKSAGTHWCGGTADNTYACWNDRVSTSHMFCLFDPWDRTLRRVPVTNLDQDTPAYQDPLPFGIELTDGGRCTFRVGGAWGFTPPGTVAIYGCDNGWILLQEERQDAIRRSDGTWSVLAYHEGPGGPGQQEAAQWVEIERVYWMVAGS